MNIRNNDNNASLIAACFIINSIVDELKQAEKIDSSQLKKLSEIINNPQSIQDIEITQACSEQETINTLINTIFEKDIRYTWSFFKNILFNTKSPFAFYINNYRDPSGNKIAISFLLLFINQTIQNALPYTLRNLLSHLELKNLNPKERESILEIETFEKQALFDFLLKKNNNTIANYEIAFLFMLYRCSPEDRLDIINNHLNKENELTSNLLRIIFTFNNNEEFHQTISNFNDHLYFPINCNEDQKNIMQTSTAHLFNKLNQPLNSTNKIKFFDELEERIDAARPMKSMILSTKRKKIHFTNYPDASYQDECYIPKAMPQDLKERIDIQIICCILEAAHITNLTHIQSVIDDGILSRKRLNNSHLAFIPAALSEQFETADYDTVCFSFNDTDSCALANASKINPPIKITIDFKKLLKLRKWEKGSLFVKEHDLYWSTKPNGDIKEFALNGIPAEFSDPISCGKLNIDIYRNHCGIKILVGDERYIIMYPRNNEANKEADAALKRTSNKSNIVGLVDRDFGQNIYYGSPDNVDNFFVFQFFRHIEKFPQLSEKIYSELNTLSNDALLNFLNSVGKKLTHGSELNFIGSIYLPLECIIKFEYLKNFTTFEGGWMSYQNPGANRLFSLEQYEPYCITTDQILNWVKTDSYDNLLAFKENMSQLFQSTRFIRYLLKHCPEQTKTYNFLEEQFNICFYNIKSSQFIAATRRDSNLT